MILIALLTQFISHSPCQINLMQHGPHLQRPVHCLKNWTQFWMTRSSEDFVEKSFQNYHNDLQQVIIKPLQVASKLLQEKVVSNALVSEVSTLGRSQLQNSTAIISAVTASIHSKPDQFQVFMSVLEDRPESANLARRMRNELSE